MNIIFWSMQLLRLPSYESMPRFPEAIQLTGFSHECLTLAGADQEDDAKPLATISRYIE